VAEREVLRSQKAMPVGTQIVPVGMDRSSWGFIRESNFLGGG
jgi:hypothetical protein